MEKPHESTSNEARDLYVDGRAVEMKLYISSKPLTEVSPYFDTLLNGGFIEGAERNLGSLRRVVVKDVEADAFAILMQILDLRGNGLVRSSITAGFFFKTCILIDVYILHEQKSLHTDS